MKAQIQKGDVIDLTAPAGDVVSGNAYLHGGLLAVAQISKVAGAKYSGVVEGVFDLPKEATTAAFLEGETVYWDNTNFRFDESSAGRFPCGTCVKAAIASDASVHVKLAGQAVAAV